MAHKTMLVVLNPHDLGHVQGAQTIDLKIDEQLKGTGWEIIKVHSMMGALEYLRGSHNKSHALLTSLNIPLLENHQRYDVSTYRGPAIPKEFHKGSRACRGGEALIRYVRKKNLVDSDIPAYLAEKFPKTNQSDGTTKVIDLLSPLAEQLQPSHLRKASKTDNQTGFAR